MCSVLVFQLIRLGVVSLQTYNVAPALVDETAIMRCSENLIQNPPLFRLVHNYAMLSRLGLKGGGPGSQKLKKVLNKKLRVILVSSLIEIPCKFHYETGPQTIFQGSSPRAA